MNNLKLTEISLVVPVYDEDQAIDLFLAKVIPILDGLAESFEIVFVNDGSRDGTLAALLEARRSDPRIKIVDLSRNFGKEAALSAGLELACGDAVIPIDVDLQDPPEVISDLVAKWREGFDMVLAKRADRSSDGMAKRLSSRLFYKLIGQLSDVPIPADVGDFRLMSREVVEALKCMPERTRFMKGMFAWLGFRQAVVTYVRSERVAGTTKWKPRALWRLALEGIVSFSSLPLKLWSYLGFGCALFSLVYGLTIITRVLFLGIDVPGYASLITFIMFFNGVTLMGLGVIGEYVARIFVEVKGRPLYVVREAFGIELPLHDRPRTREGHVEAFSANRRQSGPRDSA